MASWHVLSAIVLLCLNAVHAWSLSRGPSGNLNFGSAEQQAIFKHAAMFPNESASVPFQLGGRDIDFRVNVSDVALRQVDTSIEAPRAMLTTYDLAWAVNATIGKRVCMTVLDAKISVKSADGLSEGNCTSAVGSACVRALMAYDADCATPFVIPAACQTAFANNNRISTCKSVSMYCEIQY